VAFKKNYFLKKDLLMTHISKSFS